jgi:hypothetical protein
MQEFAIACTIDCDDDKVWLVQVCLTDSVSNPIPLSGKDSDNKNIHAILNDFLDVLVSELA